MYEMNTPLPNAEIITSVTKTTPQNLINKTKVIQKLATPMISVMRGLVTAYDFSKHGMCMQSIMI